MFPASAVTTAALLAERVQTERDPDGHVDKRSL